MRRRAAFSLVGELRFAFASLVVGSGLAEIQQAGDWRSAAFLDYLDRQFLEDDVAKQTHLEVSLAESDVDADG